MDFLENKFEQVSEPISETGKDAWGVLGFGGQDRDSMWRSIP